MTPADVARRLFRDQCNIGPNSALEAYGETAAVKAMVPLIEALQAFAIRADRFDGIPPAKYFGDTDCVLRYYDNEPQAFTLGECRIARAALTPQPEEVA